MTPTKSHLKTFDLTGWSVAFEIKVAQDIISPTDPSYTGYQENIGWYGDEKSGSLARFYMTASEPSAPFLKGSSFANTEVNNISPHPLSDLLEFDLLRVRN